MCAAQAVRTPAVVVLGVARSGTELLRAMLNSHSELAIPPESYFIPALWARHGQRVRRERFLSDLGRVPRTRDWPPAARETRASLAAEAAFSEAIHTVYGSYADARGKPRYGDKTTAHLHDLAVLDRAFPDARYVHIVRDGRDAALSFAAMRERPRMSLRSPLGSGDFAAEWRIGIESARRFGGSTAAGRYLELRYEDLIADPEPHLRQVSEFADLAFERAMLEYHRNVDPVLFPNHPRLAEPPGRGARDWRTDMPPKGVERFEAVAGDLLSALGYERAFPVPSGRARATARAVAAASNARRGAWRASAAVWRRTPAWGLRPV